jgi:hypothetical protein
MNKATLPLSSLILYGALTNMTTTEPLSLIGLLDLASESYPDGFLAKYFDPDNGEFRQASGDTLAQFVVVELSETFDPNASRSDQLEEARRVLHRAVDDLEGVIKSLQ